MLLRRWNNARRNNPDKVAGRRGEENDAPKPKKETTKVPADADGVAAVTLPEEGSTSQSACQNRRQKRTDNNVLVVPSVTLSASSTAKLGEQQKMVSAAATTDAASKHRLRTKDRPNANMESATITLHGGRPWSAKNSISISDDKQRLHPNFGSIRQLSNRQSSNNHNEMMPDLVVDLNKVDDDDEVEDRTISLLENECIKLTHVMSLLRDRHCKYTEEWFLLETRLKRASEELDAAREDRDLHFLSCSGGFSSGSGSGVCGDIINTPQLPSEVYDEFDGKHHDLYIHIGDISTDDCDHQAPISSVGIYPETESSMIGDEYPINKVVEAKVSEEPIADNHNEHQDGGISPTSSRHRSKSTDNMHQQVMKYQQIESELQRCIKFTPEWFKLKEDLVELCIELDSDNKEVDTSNDDEYEDSVEGLKDAPREINILMLSSGTGVASGNTSIDQLLTTMTSENGVIPSSIVSSPPMSPISQGSLSSPQGSHTLSPSAENGTQTNSNNAIGPNAGNGGGNPSICSPPSFHRTASGKSGIANNNLSIYCYSFNDIDSDDDGGKEQKEEDNHNVIITRLKTEHASLSDELDSLPQFSKEWFEVKMKMVCISEQIVRLELEEVTTEVLDNHSVGGDSESLDGESSKNYSSGWSSVDVWSESEDEIWSYADDLEVVMVTEALKQHPSLYIDESSSFDDELLFMPQHESAMVVEADHRDTARMLITELEAGKGVEPDHGLVMIQALVRGMVQREKYLRQRRMAIRIQCWQRRSSVRSSYKQTLANVSLIQVFVRSWITQRNPITVRVTERSTQCNTLEEKVLDLSIKLMAFEDFSPEFEDAAESIEVLQEELRIGREAESRNDETSRDEELKGKQQQEEEDSQTERVEPLVGKTGSSSEKGKVDANARVREYDDDAAFSILNPDTELKSDPLAKSNQLSEFNVSPDHGESERTGNEKENEKTLTPEEEKMVS